MGWRIDELPVEGIQEHSVVAHALATHVPLKRGSAGRSKDFAIPSDAARDRSRRLRRTRLGAGERINEIFVRFQCACFEFQIDCGIAWCQYSIDVSARGRSLEFA